MVFGFEGSVQNARGHRLGLPWRKHLDLPNLSRKSVDMEIRRATLQDAPRLVEGNRRMAKLTEGIELDLETLRKGVNRVLEDETCGHYWVAEKDGRYAGQLMLTWEWSDWRNGRFYWVQSVWVEPDFRRQGVYRALWNRVKEAIQTDPEAWGARLYVEKDNEAAQYTYAALGMHETEYRLYEWKAE